MGRCALAGAVLAVGTVTGRRCRGTGATTADARCSRAGYPSGEASAGWLLASYGYTWAARGALCLAALFGRFIRNLRRYVGDDVPFFAAALSGPRSRGHLMGSPGWAAALIQ
jgi:hypothetical protein